MKLHIKIPKFKKWNPKSPPNREWVAIDTEFFSDKAVKKARRRCQDAPDCFISLWSLLDADGNLTITERDLKEYWVDLFCASNRYDVMKRLEVLEACGLLEYSISKGDQNTDPIPNGVSNTHSNGGSNDVLTPFRNPLETGAIKNQDMGDHDQDHGSDKDKTHTAGVGAVSFAGECWLLLREKIPGRFDQADWVVSLVDRLYDALGRQRPEMSEADFETCWRRTIEAAQASGAMAPQWFDTTFTRMVSNFKPMPVSPATSGVRAARSRVETLLAAPAIVNVYDPAEVIPVSELETRDGAPGALFRKGQIAALHLPDYAPANHPEAVAS